MSGSSVPLKCLLDGVEETDRKLGGGGFGSVFLARWNGCRVAIKRLHPTVMGIDEITNKPTDAFVKFMKEYPTLSRLSHPSIVQVFGMVRPASVRGSHGLVMELLPVTLKVRYGQYPSLKPGQEVDVMISVVSGLHYLHQKGILHRDLTTSNVMMAENAGYEGGTVHAKIIDSGVARVLADAGIDELTMTIAPGAERYTAPEACEAERDQKVTYGCPADIFSLGVLVMAMCNRCEPPGMSVLVLRGRSADLADLKRLDHPLYNLVVRCVARNPAKRPTSEQLCSDLTHILRHLPPDADVCVTSETENGGSELATLRAAVFRLTAERDRLQGDCTNAKEENARLSARLAVDATANQRVAYECDRLQDERHTITSQCDGTITDHDSNTRGHDQAASRLTEENRYAGTGQVTVRAKEYQPPCEELPSSQELTSLQQESSQEHLQDSGQRTSNVIPQGGHLREVECSSSPDMELVIQHSQLSAQTTSTGSFSFDPGLAPRCRRLFAVNGVLPSSQCSPRWRVKESRLPGQLSWNSRSCVSGNHFYCATRLAGSADGVALSKLNVSGIGQDPWESVKLPAGTWNDHAYFFSYSGMLYSILCSTDPTSDNYLFFRTLSGNWRFFANLPERLFYFEIAVVGPTLLVIGGTSSLSSDFKTPSKSVYAIDLASRSRQWTSWADLPCGFTHPQLAVVGSYLHLLGYSSREGCFSEGEVVLSMDMTVPVHSRSWECDVLPALPCSEFYPTALNNQLAAVGGVDDQAIAWNTRHAYLFVPECRQYLRLPSVTVASRPVLCFSHANALYLLAVGSDGNRQNMAHFHELSM